MSQDQSKPVIAPIIAGTLCTLVGIGVARFAYTPLLPAIIQNQWFLPADAAYLGSANLLGYFFGALLAYTFSRIFSPKKVIVASCIIIAMSLLLCSTPNSYTWFFFWRFISGLNGAMLIVLGPSYVLSSAPKKYKSIAGTFVFCGIGIGALLSSIIVPQMLFHGLHYTWVALAALTFLAGIACQFLIEEEKINSDKTQQSRQIKPGKPDRLKFSVILFVMFAYALDGMGFVPHTVFWSDYLIREEGIAINLASEQWSYFAIGAILGPLICSVLVSKFGWSKSLRLAFAMKALAILIPFYSTDVFSRTVSSFIVGAMVPGIVSLTSGMLSKLVDEPGHKKIWGIATASFAFSQAASGFAMSAFYDYTGSYRYLFLVGSTLLLLGLLFLLAITQLPYYQNVKKLSGQN